MRIRPFVAVASLLFVIGTAQGQEQQIPKELALALIPYGGTDGGEILVGQLPPDLATTFPMRSGARVLGSFVSLTFTQSVIVFPGRPDSAAAFARRSLTELGWTPREPLGSRFGGLRYRSPESVPTTFCKSGSPDAMTVATQFHGPATLVRLTRNLGSSACDTTLGRSGGLAASSSVGTATGQVISFEQRMMEMPLASVPPLYSPGDVRTSQTCRQGARPPGAETQTQPLRTELSLPEILAYYGKQLDSAGWKPVVASDGQSVSGTWNRATTGQEVTISVSKTPHLTGCYEVSLRATTRGGPR